MAAEDVDIVTRLRSLFYDHDEECAAWVSGASTDVIEEKCDCSRKIITDAADEIERLRASSWASLNSDDRTSDKPVEER